MIKSPFGNTPGYKLLCRHFPEFAARGPISQYDLDHLLSILGDPHSLQSLLLVLENFEEITYRTPGICNSGGFSFLDELIGEAKATSQTLIRGKDIFENKIRLLAGRDGNREGSFHGLVATSPLYARMGLLPENRLFCPQFYLLMAEILVAHLLTRSQGCSDSLKSQLVYALDTVQALTRTEDLAKFPLDETPPHLYCKQLESHPEKILVRPIIRYLEQASDLNLSNAIKTRNTSTDKGREKRSLLDVLGKTRLSTPASPPPTELLEGLDDTEPERSHAPPGSLIFIAKPALAFLPSPEFTRAAEGLKKSRARENQQFHFSWSTLNQYELHILFDFLFPESLAEDTGDVSVRTQLALIFLAGLTPERLAKMILLRPGQPPPEGDAYFESTTILRIFSPGPPLKSVSPPESLAQACPTQNYIDLPLPDSLVTLINQHLDHSQPRVGMTLFPVSASEIQASCRQALGKLGHKRLSFKRIQNYMTRRLALLPGSDQAVASLAQGKDNIFLAQTPVHYASFEADTLQRLCNLAWVNTAREAGHDRQLNETFPAESSRYVGTPLRPNLATVQNLVAAVKTFLTNNVRINSLTKLVEYHNAYVLHTFLVTAYCTGYRAVTSPFVSKDMYDPTTGFCVIRDKSSAEFYHSRLVWLPELCIKQLESYYLHLETIKKCSVLPIIETSRKDGIYFFLTPDGRRETVRPANLKTHLAKFGFHLPVNVSRHFLKSELQENGCPSEIVEILLGHWRLGQEGWARASALHPWDFKSELARHLPPLMNRLGLTHLEGLKRVSTKIPLCLHERTPRENRDLRQQHSARTSKRVKAFFAQHEPGEAWVKILPGYFRDKTGADRFKKQEQVVLVKMHTLLPELYEGKRDITISIQSLQALMRRVQPRPLHLRHHMRRLNFLIDGLIWGKENRNWAVEIPTRPVFTLNTYNFARPSLIRKIKVFRAVEQMFMADLTGPISDVREVQIGQILISAILYGGIHHPAWAEGLIAGLTEDLFQWGDMLWVDLWAAAKDYQSPEEKWFLQRNPAYYRRWIADPTTQLLLSRWLRDPASSGGSDRCQLATAYGAYVAHIDRTQGRTLPPLTELFAAGNAWTVLTMPSYLAAYAANKIQAASLPDPAWMRLLTGEFIPTHPRMARPKRRAADGPLLEPSEQATLLRDLRALIRSYEPAPGQQDNLTGVLRTYLAEREDVLWPITALLGNWAVQLLSNEVSKLELRDKKTPLAPNSVSDYLEQISPGLLEVVGEMDVTDLEYDDLSVSMIAVADVIRRRRVPDLSFPQAHLSQVKNDLGRLNQFLGFLHVFHSTPKLSIRIEKDTLTIQGEDAVRANVVTPQEYRRLLEMLGWGKPTLTRSERMTLVAAILAFRAGLRVMEIWGLLIGDLQGTDRLELLVQGNHIRELKTRASRRREPLYILVPADELEFVREWHRFRQAELGSTACSPLFSSGPMEADPCHFEGLLAPLRYALRVITGDRTTVPHTLRHSFASFLQVGLQLRDDIDPGKYGCFLNAPEFGRTQRRERRKMLMENDNTGRKSLYVGATLLGHADTHTGLHSYIHLCDWFLGYYARHHSCRPPIKAAQLIQMAGISESYAHKIVARGGHPLELLSRLADQFSVQIPRPPKTEPQPQPTIRTMPVEEASLLDDLDCAIQNSQIQGDLPAYLSWPKSLEEIRILGSLYQCVLDLDKQGQREALQIAPLLSAAYRPYDRSLILDKPESAPQVTAFLTNLGILFVAEHHRSRWVREAKRHTAGYLSWREQLGDVHLWRGRRQSGRKWEQGAVQLSLQAIVTKEFAQELDRKIANVFGVLIHLLQSQCRE